MEARRWINDLVQHTAVVAGLRLTVRIGQLLSFVKFDDQGKPEMDTVCDMLQQRRHTECVMQVIPLLDGGTEGFKGHSRVIIPGVTADMVGAHMHLWG